MKKSILAFSSMALLLLGCATTTQYDSNEFETKNYQANISQAVNTTTILQTFDGNYNDTEVKVSPDDLTKLVQADMYFNQSDYASAATLYKYLAYKYKTPQLIYKAIFAIERSGIGSSGMLEMSNLVDLFLKVQPASNLARLFQIKLALFNDNLVLAEKDLNYTLSNNPSQAREMLIFLTSILGVINNSVANSSVMDDFATYVLNQYATKYPEAYLLASTMYAISGDGGGLYATLEQVSYYYPHWKIPLYLSCNILINNNNRQEALDVLQQIIGREFPEDIIIQNMYVGLLIDAGNLSTAEDYLVKQMDALTNSSLTKDSQYTNNVSINLGIVYAKEQKYTMALKYLTQASSDNPTTRNVLAVLVAALYDYTGDPELAVKYYLRVTDNQYLQLVTNVMLLNDYAQLKQTQQIADVLDKMAAQQNLSGAKAILYKVSCYVDLQDYASAYALLQRNFVKYKSNLDYFYQYAAISALAGKSAQAIRLYREYLLLKPNSAAAYNDLAFVYSEDLKDYKQALIYAKKAQAVDFMNANIADTLGWVYYRMGDYKTAYIYVNSSYQAEPNPDVAGHLKAVLSALHRPDLASKITIADKADTIKALRLHLVQQATSFLATTQYAE